MGNSTQFEDYLRCAKALSSSSWESLLSTSPEGRKAFLINVYNCLTMHVLTHIKGMERTLDVKGEKMHFSPNLTLDSFLILGMWTEYAYNIGGKAFSLDDIEHGLLRCNRAHPSGKIVLSQGDERQTSSGTSTKAFLSG